MSIALLRHGRTPWNEAGRMQGRADVGLSDAGREQVRGWNLPPRLRGARFVSSPLARARETAALLSDGRLQTDDALIEMDWGAWEGETLAALREREGEAFARESARGLDFRPPGGETPRDVQRRIAAWLDANVALREDIVAVTHQGVVRTVVALITGWDMIGKPPVRLHDDVAHFVELDGAGLRATWNIPLVDAPLRRRNAVAATRSQQ